MNLRFRTVFLALGVFLSLGFLAILRADEDDNAERANLVSPGADPRYGLFGLLDHRSSYGHDLYPEPFLVDDSDLEENELRLDWFHSKAGALRSDIESAGAAFGIGLLTIEVEASYERDAAPQQILQGTDAISVSARHPFFQYVALGGFFDTTFGAGVEFGIPTHSTLSRNFEWAPRLFDDLRFGKHVTLQSTCGYSMLLGSGENGDLHVLEYGCVLAYTIPESEFRVPAVDQINPIFELSGEKQLNHGSTADSLLGSVGFRVNLKAIRHIEPHLGVAYVFPVDGAAREELHHGIYTSIVLNF